MKINNETPIGLVIDVYENGCLESVLVEDGNVISYVLVEEKVG